MTSDARANERTRARVTGAVLSLGLSLATSEARAQNSTEHLPSVAREDALPEFSVCTPRSFRRASETGAYAVDYHRRRIEPAGLPLITSSPDVGFEFGAVGFMSYFANGCRPYFWNQALTASMAIKTNSTGVDISQYNVRWQMDLVGLFRGRLRLNPAVFVDRAVAIPYFGLGNGERATVPDTFVGERARFNQFASTDVWAFLAARFLVKRPFSIGLSVAYQFAETSAYPGSLLEREAALRDSNGQPVLRGLGPLHMWRTAALFVIDTRDNEVMPRRGWGFGLWGSFNRGFPLSSGVAYATAGMSVSSYVPVVGPLIFAWRAVADLQFGNAPFFDLARGATPYPIDMPGGAGAVRGVPAGRYLGPIKFFGNAELRAFFFSFTVLQQRFTIGAEAFFDAGRVFSDYTFTNPIDGPAPGIKWGTGLGALFRWGQAAVFRVELAYSPDQLLLNPSFPFALYIVDDVAF